MTWTFYIRFEMQPNSWLEGSEPSSVVNNDGKGREVTMYSLTPGLQQEPKPLAEARTAVIEGVGYSTESEALEAGKLWRARLMEAFAALRIGADFKDRTASQVSFSREAMAAVSQATSRPAVNYRSGILVYESDSRPSFMPNISGTVRVSNPSRFDATLAKMSSTVGLSEERQVTYDLFSAALGLGSRDARYAMLMAALETMLNPQSRSKESVTHVDNLIELTRKSGLPEEEIDSITATLKWLRRESIGQAGKRIAEMLKPNTYMNEAPAVFFRKCYDLRSNLMHGNYPLPTTQEISARIPHLEQFISDLIGLTSRLVLTRI
jgi:hypothetical protein